MLKVLPLPTDKRWVYVLWKGTDELLGKEYTSPAEAYNTLRKYPSKIRVVMSVSTHCNERQWTFRIYN